MLCMLVNQRLDCNIYTEAQYLDLTMLAQKGYLSGLKGLKDYTLLLQ